MGVRSVSAPILAILSCASALAQNYPGAGRTSIRGSVRNTQTHQALYRVIVDVEADSGGNAAQVITDSTGKFDVEGLDAAVYLVRVRFPGYDEVVERVDLTVASSNYLDIQLKPKPGSNPPTTAPEGPSAALNARLAGIPDKARKEFDRGRECLDKGENPQSCAEHFDKAIKQYPKFADAYTMEATAYLQQNNVDGAKTALQQAIRIDPKMPEAWLISGMLQNREKDYPTAEKSLTECLALDQGLPQAHYELSRTYMAMGNVAEAEPHALKAAQLQPSMAPVHIILGNIALKKNDGLGALNEFQEYLKLDPKGPMAQSAQAMIDKIKSVTNAKP